MRGLFLVAILFSSNTFAMQLNCSKEISSSRVESTNIRSWPYLYLTRGFQECVDHGGQTACHGGVLEDIANEHEVCFRQVDFENDCHVKESGDYNTGFLLEIKCVNNTELVFIMERNKLGKITCLENSTIKKQWDVGVCQKE